MRLNRFLASAGLGSRRSCEELIRTGQVTINGVLCENLATTVEPSDVVKVGQRVLHSAAPMTLLLHKPPGYVCTASDERARQTIFDLLPPHFPRLFHVGRLDRDSEGLLLLTNDGELSLKLTHPRYKVEKEYEVVLDRSFDFERTEKLLHGISLEEGWAKAEAVFKLGPNKLKVILRQGLKRQIRKMFYALGYEVEKLVRVRIGSLKIGDMPPGTFRALTQKEIETLLTEGTSHAAEPETETPARPPRRPAARYASRPPFGKRREEGAQSRGPRRSFGEREERFEKPYRKPGAKPGFKPGPKFQHRDRGPAEEISFVPRARRGEEEHAAGPGARPGRKPAEKFAGKPWLKPWKEIQAKKAGHGVKKQAKAGPHPFAKFARRRPEA